MDTLQGLINILSTPVANRKGVTFTPENCKDWVELLENLKDKLNHEKILQDYYNIYNESLMNA